MAPPNRADQEALERLWDASRRTYEQARRRQFCADWIEHHRRLADAFRGHANRHEEERRRYESLLRDMHTKTEGEL